MNSWKKVFVWGVDVEGRRCRVAQVNVPTRFTQAEAARYIRNTMSGFQNIADADVEMEVTV